MIIKNIDSRGTTRGYDEVKSYVVTAENTMLVNFRDGEADCFTIDRVCYVMTDTGKTMDTFEGEPNGLGHIDITGLIASGDLLPDNPANSPPAI